MFVIGSSTITVVASPGTPLTNAVIIPPPPYFLAFTDVTASVLVTAEIDRLQFQMPDFYRYIPECIRNQDLEFVDRGNVPLYYWDSVPDWDTEPFRWDEVIGPEPILKTTIRIVQTDFERQLKDIQSIADLYKIRKAPRDILPYHASLLGTPLPGVGDPQQRSFLEELVATYRNKGTPLSFFKLFEQLGFDLDLRETYQKKKDGAEIDGPQIALKSNPLVIDEPVGTTVLGQVIYRFQTINRPVTRGSVKLEVFDQSATDPTVIIDNGEGEWSDGIGGFVDYLTGNMEVTMSVTPALSGQPIQVSYEHRVDPFPDSEGRLYQNRFRSSIVQFAIEPKNSGVSLTEEIIDRIQLYLELLKPAHIVIRNLDLILKLEDTETVDDDLNPITYNFIESLFGTLYRGNAWASEDNGSRDPASTTFPQSQHRVGNEFLKDPSSLTPADEAPYVYPWFKNGIFRQPNSGNDFEADWTELPSSSSFETTITNDDAQTTTTFSINQPSPTTLGIGDHCAFVDGPNGGESRIISGFVDNTTYYSVTVSPAFPKAPIVGDNVTILDIDGPNRKNLDAGFRQQETLDLYFGHVLSPAPNGISTGPFTVTISTIPLLGGSTSYLRFTIGSTNFEETATGTGPFTNTFGHISASSIDYTSGAVSVTFGTAPDAGSSIEVYSTISGLVDIGDY